MSALSVDVLQLNVAGDNARTHAILTSPLFDRFGIILLQDIWWSRIGGDKSGDPGDPTIYGTVSCRSWHCLLPTTNQTPNGPKVAIYYRKNVTWLTGNISNHTPPSVDNVSVLFKIHGSPFIITNTYLHGSAARATLDLLLDTPIDASVPAVYAG